MSLYQKVISELEGRREGLNSPLLLPDEHRLAAEFSVSRRTIRTALGILESRGVVTRRRRAGTYLQPLKGLALDVRGKRIGVVTPWWAAEPTSWYYSVILDNVSRWTEANECAFTVLNPTNRVPNEHRWIERLRRQGVDAIFWVQPQNAQFELLSTTAKLFPTVVLGRNVPDRGVHCIVPDFVKAAKLIDAELLAHGHEMYAVVGKDILSSFSQSWLEGFTKAHADRGSQFERRFFYIDYACIAKRSVSTFLLDLYLEDHPEVSALVFPSSGNIDFLLTDKRFTERMRNGLSVVTTNYGLYPIESLFPGTALTHISFDWKKMTEHSMDKLALALQGFALPKQTVETVRLIRGDTVQQRDPRTKGQVDGASDSSPDNALTSAPGGR